MRIVLLCLTMTFALNVHADDYPVFTNTLEGGEVTNSEDIGLISHKSLPLKIKVKTRSFSNKDKVKLVNAVKVLAKVMNSPEFKQEVLNFSYKGDRSFHQNNGMSNEEIYRHLMTGAEELSPEHNKTMDFDLTMYRSWNPFSKVKGYTKPDTMRIWVHSKYYRRASWDQISVASNMAHEWVHKMGFGHAYYYNNDRPSSVPYAIGRIVSKVAKDLGLE
ncbi:MAG: hypothetical protein HON90_18225 [Halobacteriovoraceae bacterium]|jgi:hypothetical protein|nr:hypothetical protein [Halobacteriovoraceae bacterium]